jgi:prepilin-type N-terminal cleavage/methylation domain-containing protein
MKFIKQNKGFTLVEMIIVMAFFVIIIAITGDSFNRIITNALSQSKLAENNISGQVGLELIRSDIESAGFGLLWSFTNPITYNELDGNGPGTNNNDNNRIYTDTTQNNIPRAVVSLNDIPSSDPAVILAGTDLLTIRSNSIAGNTTGRRWTYIESAIFPNTRPSPAAHVWSENNLTSSNHVIVLNPIKDMKPNNGLVVNASGTWETTFDNYSTIGKPPVYNDAEKKSDAYIIYGVNDSTLRMPFNRADYYVRRPSSGSNSILTPQRCNNKAGQLFKGIVNHTDGKYTELPIFDCVLDFQVTYSLLTPGSSITSEVSDISNLNPSEIRSQLKEIKLYILTHDGGLDRNFNYPNATIGVGPGDGLTSGTGRTYNFATNNVPDWQHYRWKVYQITGRPKNITGNN